MASFKFRTKNNYGKKWLRLDCNSSMVKNNFQILQLCAAILRGNIDGEILIR